MSVSALEEILTSVLSIPVGLSLVSRFTPAAISSSGYYTQLHRIQSVLTLFIHLLLATSNLSLEHALYLKLSLKPKEHERKVHSLVVVTSVPRGALKVQQTVLTASLLALGAQFWLSRQPDLGVAQLARTALVHASLIISAAMTALTLPLDGPSLRVQYTLTGLESIYSQGPETGTESSEERQCFAPIDIILPALPARSANGTVIPLPAADKKDPSSRTTAAAAGEDEPDAQGWLKIAATNKKRDVYVRKTAGGRGRGWELKTELADDHPLKGKTA
ncbi:unnamed protein product [Tilletia laevis]|uniref:Uncharacterized protein n=2 Tax=Tilletia TaxID=13289 RepID=A0A177V691_9BASI|nr:hypothetical protein CF336_g4741 [Tilletia laevis]KAE8247353.1 hypothetical protein A4X03_0g7067 [Tilletia caries]KAE8200621.1 hypothetical protein CF335_g3918 [Tilletia laevis]CAD6889814.1 unnamed protein product [Tilletia caries]CAD6915757.1 unnamed protein product [Tilletia laevis]